MGLEGGADEAKQRGWCAITKMTPTFADPGSAGSKLGNSDGNPLRVGTRRPRLRWRTLTRACSLARRRPASPSTSGDEFRTILIMTTFNAV